MRRRLLAAAVGLALSLPSPGYALAPPSAFDRSSSQKILIRRRGLNAFAKGFIGGTVATLAGLSAYVLSNPPAAPEAVQPVHPVRIQMAPDAPSVLPQGSPPEGGAAPQPASLFHDPALPHTFTERRMPQAPAVEDLPVRFRIHVERFRRAGRPLTDERLQAVWRAAQAEDLDPMLFLAILAAEGTGSFDTLPHPRGGRPHDDFEADLANAAQVIRREIDDWTLQGRRGDWLRWVNLGGAGARYQGGYAQDRNWHRHVIGIYNGRVNYEAWELEERRFSAIEVLGRRFRESVPTLKTPDGRPVARGPRAIRRAVERDAGSQMLEVDAAGRRVSFRVHLQLFQALSVQTPEGMAGLIRGALFLETHSRKTDLSNLKGPITLALVSSRHLGEDHRADGLVGFNAVLSRFEPSVARRLFQWVLVHEIWHEAHPKGRDSERWARDAENFIDLGLHLEQMEVFQRDNILNVRRVLLEAIGTALERRPLFDPRPFAPQA